MRYTRYSYKKKKNNSFIQFIFIITFSAILGMVLFKVVFKSMSSYIKNSPKTAGTSTISNENDKNDKKEFNFSAIQCGVFSTKDAAESIKNNIPNEYPAFIIEEEGKFKVIAAICVEGEVEAIINKLNEIGVNNYSIKFTLNTKNSLVEYELINGCLQLINKISDNSIMSINTNEFKEWVNKVCENKKDEDINELKNRVNLIEEEFKKENRTELMVYLYNILLEYKI